MNQFKPFDMNQFKPFDMNQFKPFDMNQIKPFDMNQFKPFDMNQLLYEVNKIDKINNKWIYNISSSGYNSSKSFER